MKVAIISDIHSNLEALGAVLKDIKKLRIKNIICAGDIVGYGADPNECCNVIRQMKIPSVLGNHDRASIDLKDLDRFNSYAQQALRWTNKILSKENKEFISKLHKSVKIEVDNRTIIVTHGSLNDPLFEYIYPNTSDNILNKMVSKVDVLVLGHTHHPFIRKLENNKIVINPGSVGQPRDNIAKASYAIYDTSTFQTSIRRISYDINKASKKIITAQLPNYLAERLFQGK